MKRRILQVVGGMNRAGTETWLMHVLRNIDRQQFQMDFLVHTEEPGDYDEEIRSLGAKVIPCLSPSNPWLYARNFRQILQEHGPYDVVHSHVHHFTGYVVRIAKENQVPIRIAHSHSDVDHASTSILRRAYLKMTEGWITKYATVGLAASAKAAYALFGNNWSHDGRWKVFHCGVDLEPFQQSLSKKDIRRELGIPLDAFVIGHAGRFVPVKNHRFIIDVFIEVLRSKPDSHLLLIGEGPLRPDIEAQAELANIKNRMHFVGTRSDVPLLMRGAMNAFLFPSIREGLGLVGIEAQAAGLPTFITESLPKELSIVDALVHRVPISAPAAIWAQCIISKHVPSIMQQEALEVVSNSEFNIARSIKDLCDMYLDHPCSITTSNSVS
jgi:glycosyltransferase involved in cell wall biosynthesis